MTGRIIINHYATVKTQYCKGFQRLAYKKCTKTDSCMFESGQGFILSASFLPGWPLRLTGPPALL